MEDTEDKKTSPETALDAVLPHGLPDEDTFLDEDRLFNEVNLLRVEGYYFCLDPRAASHRLHKQTFIERLKLPDALVEHPISIEPHPTYGYPSVLAYKVLQAIMKKLTDYGYPSPESVSFTQRELARLCGRQSFGGKQSQEFFRAAMQLNSTRVWCSFYDKASKLWQAMTFYVVDSCLFSGMGQNIQHCVFHLHPAIIQSLNNRYSFCLNYSRMEGLEPIGTALYKRLFFHFSNLYSRLGSETFTFTKDYAAICASWLGGIKPERYKSMILSNQLGRHLRDIKEHRLIRSVAIEKNADGSGFNLLFHPGSGFFEDYRRFYGATVQLEMQFQKVSDEHTIQQPIELVAYFYRRLYGIDAVDDTIFSDRETAFAVSLLAHHNFETVQAWIDFALQEAKATGFAMKTFGGIRIYGPAFEARQKELEKSRQWQQAQAEQRQERSLREAYARFQREEIRRARERLGTDELTALETEVRAALAHEEIPEIGARFLLRVRTDQAIVQRCHIPTFEQWRADQVSTHP